MKIKRITCSGYKNIGKFDIDLHDFNVIVGVNNSGKSNFVEIPTLLHFLFYLNKKEDRDVFFSNAKFNKSSILPNFIEKKQRMLNICIQIEMARPGGSMQHIDYEAILEFHGNHPQKITGFFSREKLKFKEVGAKGAPTILFERNGTELKVNQPGNTKKKIIKHKIEETISVFQSIFVNYPWDENYDWLWPVFSIPMSFELPYFSFSAHELRDNLSSSNSAVINITQHSFDINLYLFFINENARLREKFEKWLCAILDLRSAEIIVREKPKEILSSTETEVFEKYFVSCRLENNDGRDMKLQEASDGTLKVTAILAAVLLFQSDEEQRGLPLIFEEPENGLHPKALIELIRFLKTEATNTQIILTTHSPYLLNEVRPEDVLIMKPQPKKGSTIERLPDLRSIRRALKDNFMGFGEYVFDDMMDD